jgi:hypothetical protein
MVTINIAAAGISNANAVIANTATANVHITNVTTIKTAAVNIDATNIYGKVAYLELSFHQISETVIRLIVGTNIALRSQ